MSGNAARRRVNQRSDMRDVQYPVDGTAAYVPEEPVFYRGEYALPYDGAYRREAGASREVKRNRSKALAVNKAFVLFLTLISAATVVMCVRYLRLKETITAQISANEKLESSLVSLRSENDALLECVSNDVDWNYIRETAVNKLGMKYAAEEQIVWYNTEDCCYVRQFQDVPSP